MTLTEPAYYRKRPLLIDTRRTLALTPYRQRTAMRNFVICWKYAFEGVGPSALAREFGVSIQRIKQIVNKHNVSRASIPHGQMPPDFEPPIRKRRR